MDKLPPAISMFVSTVSTTIHLTVKSSAFDGPPAQNTWHVLPHSHSSEHGVLVRRSSTGRQVAATRTSVAVQTVSSQYVRVLAPFLGALAKLRKVTISVMPARPFIRPHVTTWLAMGGLFMKFDIRFLENLSRKSRFY